MKINVNQIPFEGLVVLEALTAAELELDSVDFKFPQPIRVRLEAQKITNAVTLNVTLKSTLKATCSCCICEFDLELDQRLTFNYQIEKLQDYIDPTQDIREEIILGLPMRVLCKEGCKGLCPGCGKDLNQGNCSCK